MGVISQRTNAGARFYKLEIMSGVCGIKYCSGELCLGTEDRTGTQLGNQKSFGSIRIIRNMAGE